MTQIRSRKGRLLLPLALAAACLLLAVGLLGAARAGVLGGGREFHGTAWEPSETAADFRLTDHTGRQVSLADYRGKAILLFFGYASCPDVCPLTLARLQRVLEGMGEDAEEVEVLLVTVDPERDTPEALAGYVARFGPRVTGLTGDPGALERMRKRYYVYAEPAPPAPQIGGGSHGAHVPVVADLNHTPQVFGIDRRGEIRVLLPMERTEEEIADDVRTLLGY